MEQKQSIQNKPHDNQGEKKCCISPTVTGIAIAVWIFIGLTALLWVVISNNITDEAKRFEVGIMAMLNIAIVVIVVVHAVIYHNQTKAMIAQGETSLRQFEITDRPWLMADISLASPLTFDSQGGHLTFKVAVKNVGRSVAVNMTINAKMVIPNPAQDIYGIVATEHAYVCRGINSEIASYALFPERSHIQEISFGLVPQEMEQGRLGGSAFFYLFFVGCVDYQFSGHEGHHQTGFSYQVINTGGGNIAVRVGENVSREHLSLYKPVAGKGDYAN
jgi:hypothetical protein